MRVLFIWERERGECSEKKQVILEVSNKDTSLSTALGRGNGLGKAGKTPGVCEPPSQWGWKDCVQAWRPEREHCTKEPYCA